MSATNEHLINFFHENFSTLNTADTVKLRLLIRNLINYAKEIHLQNATDQEQLNQLPLLAIFSKIMWEHLPLLDEIAIDEPILQAALDILSSYPLEKRYILEKHFL